MNDKCDYCGSENIIWADDFKSVCLICIVKKIEELTRIVIQHIANKK